MPYYTEDRLEYLEESAQTARPGDQSQALALVAGILERNAIAYGVMGGMNFYLRGSSSTTGDADIAVDNPPRMEALLSIFNSHESIHRPTNRMQWVSGVARIFAEVGTQYVQLDLKPKGSEGHLIPRDIANSVERMSFTVAHISFQCNMLAIGPLVAAKLKSYYNRETQADLHDLLFIVRSTRYAPQARQASGSYRQEWIVLFLEKALEKDKKLEQEIRWTFNMERSRSNSGR